MNIPKQMDANIWTEFLNSWATLVFIIMLGGLMRYEQESSRYFGKTNL